VAVREFSDTSGTSWRAWNITPESSPPTREARTAYTDLHDTGWIVFETPDGREKRRLCPYPDQWATMSDAELLQLLVQASAVRRSRLALGHETPDAAIQKGGPAETELSTSEDRSALGSGGSATTSAAVTVDFRTARSFRYPGGRLWTVRVARIGDDGAQVLRFTAGLRTLDLTDWPRDWATFETDELVALLRSVARLAPRPLEHPADALPAVVSNMTAALRGRRYSDR
jgi:hypothetical protein